MSKRAFIIGSILVLSAAMHAYAQRSANMSHRDTVHSTKDTTAYRTNEVVVEDEPTRFGVSPLRSVDGAGIYEAKKSEVITMSTLAANTASNNARQIYARVAGLHVWDGDGAGSQLSVATRGLSPNRTSSFNVRQNGYDIAADALGYPESYYTPAPDAIERIEIVRGAGSLQYGTQFGGMLNFRLKRGPEDTPLQFGVRTTGGSFGFATAFVDAGGTVGDVNYYAYYQFRRSDGWRPNSGLYSHLTTASTTWQASSAVRVNAEYTYYEYQAQQPGGLTDAMFAADPTQSVRARNWFAVQWHLPAVTAQIKVSPLTDIDARLFALSAGRDALGDMERITVQDLGRPRTLLSDHYTNLGGEVRLLQRYTAFGSMSTALFGVRMYDGHTTRDQGFASAGSDADFTFTDPSDPGIASHTFPGRNVAAFAETVINVGDRISITPGLRYEFIRTQAQGTYHQYVTDLSGAVIVDSVITDDIDRARSFVFAGLGVTYRLPSLELYGNVSQNYRAITFSDLRVVNPNLTVDPNIGDEHGFNADLGVRGMLGSVAYLDATAFYMMYADRIGTVLRADQAPLYVPYRYRTNIADARTIGLEAMIDVDLLRAFNVSSQHALHAFVNGAIMDARYDAPMDPTVDGREVELVPPVQVRVGGTWTVDAWTTSIQYSWTARHYTDATNAEFVSSAVAGIVPAYGVMDLTVCYRVGMWCIEGGVNNVLNARYFSRRADGYPGPGIIPGDARSLFVTIGMRL